MKNTQALVEIQGEVGVPGEGSGIDANELLSFVVEPQSTRLCDALASTLTDLGVTTAFGVVGGGIAPMSDALNRSRIQVVHTRHESGAAFAAVEASLASGRPSVVFATTGPGITNALTGLFVARREGAQVIFVSGTTPAPRRDRWALQESGPHALLGGLYTAGPLFDYATVIDHEDQVEVAICRLARGLRRPQGFVAHIAMPTSIQSMSLGKRPRTPEIDERRPERLIDMHDVSTCARMLTTGRVMLWVGYGARNCSRLVRKLAEHLGAPVMATPRAKGVFPENHPLYVGVTGLGGHEGPSKAVRALQPEHILVLGTRLGEFSSGWSAELRPSKSFIHVDVDPTVPGVSYPDVPTLGIQAELSTFLTALFEQLPQEPRASAEFEPHEPPLLPMPRRMGLVRPQMLMSAIQRVVVDDSEAIVVAEAGNSFAWTNHYLRFPRPGRYRANMGWGSMGHGATGVLGAALHHADKAVSVVGDGAMLMNCEVSTAVQYDLPVVWVVVNDSQYGMVEHGMRSAGYEPVETAIPRTDFAAFARSMGADGIRIESEDELEWALRRAMAARGPFVVDVVIDPDEVPPVGSRLNNLREQGVHSEELE
ncbi:thiamine pyrophosphate-dependent enzyme [Paraliomyxa miuraensis]|uniref:thiamine pyrophosphate-dependent enzyme n=1 Tax=Paraliomyxa miuraensis TaxID=376150 RepID=UPI002251AD06|nr:thiamine pyrophosphate-dependent enzyme [Paraliomyxa miuraensis]MCX4241939.1 thiamine pyrophosphate-binding protein [Paraliomyxa miuraensis]